MTPPTIDMPWRMTGIAAIARDLLAPPTCPITDEIVAGSGQTSYRAWGRAHWLDRPWCERCGMPFAVDHGRDVLCAACLAYPPDFDCARAAVAYDAASKRAVLAFKHGDRLDLAPVLAAWIERVAGDVMRPDAVLAPTPLHWRRQWARRYNQSAALAAAIARRAGVAVAYDALVRVRATPPQQSLPLAARRRNVVGAFRASPALAGRHVIVIDDVLTTGATASACAKALKRAGAGRVDVLAVARVVKPLQIAV